MSPTVSPMFGAPHISGEMIHQPIRPGVLIFGEMIHQPIRPGVLIFGEMIHQPIRPGGLMFVKIRRFF
jgi:hypothetical protein